MAFDWLHTRYATGVFVRRLRKEMAKELQDQGHVASGRLLNSLSTGTKQTKGKVQGVVRGLARGEALDGYQRDANLTIRKILTWMDLVNATGRNRFDFKDMKEKRRIALAILSASVDQGIPMRGAAKYSNNGTRVGWITTPYRNNLKFVDKDVVPKVVQDIEENFIRIIEAMAAKNPNIKLIK